jgi:hypothetical protein
MVGYGQKRLLQIYKEKIESRLKIKDLTRLFDMSISYKYISSRSKEKIKKLIRRMKDKDNFVMYNYVIDHI